MYKTCSPPPTHNAPLRQMGREKGKGGGGRLNSKERALYINKGKRKCESQQIVSTLTKVI